MTVKELKDTLKDCPDDMEVIISSDGEGNNHSPLYCADTNCVYVPDNTWSGNVYDVVDNSPDDYGLEDEAEEWEVLKATQRCLLLCPTN